MNQSAINVRMDAKLKNDFSDICKKAGFSATKVMAFFAKQVVQKQKIPFKAKALLEEEEDKADYEAAVKAWKEFEADGFRTYSAEEVFAEAGL